MAACTRPPTGSCTSSPTTTPRPPQRGVGRDRGVPRSSGSRRTLDFEEKAAVAAQVLSNHAGEGLADHVLVDEAQDLSPSRFKLLRALAAPGKNDLFIAKDSHQRIYGRPSSLSAAESPSMSDSPGILRRQAPVIGVDRQ